MRLSLLFTFALATTAAMAKEQLLTVSVANSLEISRTSEIVEVPGIHEGFWLVHDAKGCLLPSQRTHDGKIIFPASVPAMATATYTLTPSKVPYTYNTIVCGRVYPERVDDVAWENNLIAFRAYGPALEKSGEKAYGYDVWCKRATDHPVVEKRYFDELRCGITYHKDHGNGLDCYKVGPTLGAGTNALILDGKLLYPWVYATCEILDNGPLRFTAKLTYPPKTIGEIKNMIEVRQISLDFNTHLNKTTVIYKGLPTSVPMAIGLVRHDAGESIAEQDLIAYADPTDRPSKGFGAIFVGVLFPSPVKEAKSFPLSAAEQKHAGAIDHLVAVTPIAPGESYTYYWGAGWSHSDVKDFTAWQALLRRELRILRTPFAVTVR